MLDEFIKIADKLDAYGYYKEAEELDLIIQKIAAHKRMKELKSELLQDPNPLSKLKDLYLEATREVDDDLEKLFQGNTDRAKAFAQDYPGFVPDEVEQELVNEFGRENVDRYLYGIGAGDIITVDDVQELLLYLLDTHPKLSRRRDKNQIKERFGILSRFARYQMSILKYSQEDARFSLDDASVDYTINSIKQSLYKEVDEKMAQLKEIANSKPENISGSKEAWLWYQLDQNPIVIKYPKK